MTNDTPQEPARPAVKEQLWADLLGRIGSLSPSTARAKKMLDPLDTAAVDTTVGVRVAELLEDFGTRAWEEAGKLRALDAGASPLIVPSSLTPGQLAQQLLSGVVIDGELIAETAQDYGDGPDALPQAVEALAQRIRETDPNLRPELRLVAAFEAMSAGSAGEPGVAG